jgi:hypothetical protein
VAVGTSVTRLRPALWLLPGLLAVLFWWLPPRGDDAYYHAAGAVEQLRAWDEGAVLPRHHRGWNGGTGSFAPTIYSPIPLAVQGGLARLVGDGQRAVGLSLALALLASAAFLAAAARQPGAVVLVATPYLLAVALSRATTTEAWALAGAALVLARGLPPGVGSRRGGFALVAGVALVAGSQVGMLLQAGWLLGAAWLTAWVQEQRGGVREPGDRPPAGLRTFLWAASGLLAASLLWLPALLDRHNLALGELVAGPLDWRSNFLPATPGLGLPLTAVAIALGAVALVVATRGEGRGRWPLVAAALTALALNLEASAPLWRLAGMGFLQFPWRFLGPATIVLVLTLPRLSGSWRWLAASLLLLPSALVPLRLDLDGAGTFPAKATPAELARLVHEHWGLAPVLPSARGLYAPGFDRLASLRELGAQPATVVEEARSVAGGRWRVSAVGPSEVLLPIQWWPEWRVTVDGGARPFATRSGLVAVACPGGVSTVEASLGPSRSRTLGGRLSVFGVLLVALLARVDPCRDPRGSSE